MIKKQLGVAIGISILCFATRAVPVLAASTTLSVSPESSEVDKSFTVDVVIDGHGDKFNAAQASVTVSPQLRVDDVITGDCGFSFLTTPGITNPSFEGVALSKSLTKCTVYTLKLTPVQLGEGVISFTEVSVKRYGDAAEVLSKANSGKYIVTAVDPSAGQAPSLAVPSEGLYSLSLKIISENEKPIDQATVQLSTASNSAIASVTTNSNGSASWNNLESGVYQANIEKNGNQLDQHILNVSGGNHQISLTLKIQPKVRAFNTKLVLGLGIFAGVLIGVGAPFILKSLKTQRTKITE